MQPDLHVELTATTEAPSRARQAVRAKLDTRVPEARLRELLAVVSELVANSVKHGPGGPIHVSVGLSDAGTVIGRVEDGGDGRVAIREDVDPIEGGMGLKLVDAFTDRWGVWFELAPRRFGPALH